MGEEFVTLEDNHIKLFYHCYHLTYRTWHLHEEDLLHDWAPGHDPEIFSHLNY